ncbi:MAG: YqgE/AlgH family protein [Myxococcota bacterium]
MDSNVLAPGLLLAAPPLGDPNFNRSVVLLASHSDEGSLGWVLNGLEIAPVAQLLRDAGLTPDGKALPSTLSYEAKARVGGPVSPRSAWVLYRRSPTFDHAAQMVLDDEWAGTGDRTVVEAIARGEGPSQFRLILGYAGWAPSQLDDEIRAGAWLPARFDSTIVFDEDDGEMWERAYAKLVGVSPFAFTGMRPGSA